jgi:hypothetical protein
MLLTRLFSGQNLGTDDCDRWQSDPLSHPDLRRMTPHQLADLPFNPWRVRRTP